MLGAAAATGADLALVGAPLPTTGVLAEAALAGDLRLLGAGAAVPLVLAGAAATAPLVAVVLGAVAGLAFWALDVDGADLVSGGGAGLAGTAAGFTLAFWFGAGDFPALAGAPQAGTASEQAATRAIKRGICCVAIGISFQ